MTTNQTVIIGELAEQLDEKFTKYAFMSLEDRALPDARDGLKPSQRRILVAMNDLKLSPGGSTEKCAKICGDCFIAGTLVSTDKGLKRIEEIVSGDMVYTQTGIQKVINCFYKEEKQLLELIFSDGRKIVCTPEQQFKVFNSELEFEWKNAEHISNKDYIVCRKNTPAKGKNTNKKKEDLAYLLGFFLADGWLIDDKRKTPRICFAAKDIEILQKITGILQEHFDYNPSIREIRNNFYEIRINKNYINDQIINYCQIDKGKKAKNISIPKWIFESSSKVIWSFISGYIDGDGWVTKRHSEIGCSSISECFIRELQSLLNILGVTSSFRKLTKGKRNSIINGREVISNYDSFTLSIYSSSFKTCCANLKLICPHKKNNLLKSRKTFSGQNENIPYVWNNILKIFKDKHLGGGWYLDSFGQKIRSGLKYNSGSKIRYSKNINKMKLNVDIANRLNIFNKLSSISPDSKELELLNHIDDNDIYFTNTVSIKKHKPEKTYDIEVENEHELIVNGIIAHNCSGNYHPHGEAVIYPTLVRMTQDWVLRYPLAISQGNFGNRDGDPPAAMRYTSAKMSRVSSMLLEDMSPDTVDYQDNYNEKMQEPTILPAKAPNLLINGCAGIAVGWATEIPPHNLTEVCTAIKAYIADEDISPEDIVEIMPGPDFPNGCRILGRSGILDYYKEGRGGFKLQGIWEIKESKRGRKEIVITELPYQASPAKFISQAVDLVKKGDINGISDMKNLSSKKNGLHIWIDVSKGASPELIINTLLKKTCLQTSFSVNSTVLINGKVSENTTVKQLFKAFVEHRELFLTRKFEAERRKNIARTEIVEGLIAVSKRLDEAIKIIRNSDDPQDAHKKLIAAGIIKTDRQAEAVLAMTLRSLTKLEASNLSDEIAKLSDRKDWLDVIIGNQLKTQEIIIEELDELITKHGDDRRSEIRADASNIDDEDLITEEQVVVMLSGEGYVKRIPVNEYRVQARGGKGSRSTEKKDSEDGPVELFEAGTKDIMFFFTSKGVAYRRKAYEIPQAGKLSRGRHVSNLLNLSEGEEVTNMISMSSVDGNGFLVMITRNGYIKRTSIKDYDTNRKTAGINAIKLEDDDAVAYVLPTNGKYDIFIVTEQGNAIRYSEDVVPIQGRVTRGSRAMKLNPGDKVAQIFTLDPKDKPDIFVITSAGRGKKSSCDEYRRLGSRNVKGYAVLKKDALAKAKSHVVGACALNPGDSLLALTAMGQAIRFESTDIRNTSRTTAGVRVVTLGDGDEVTKLAKLAASEEEE